MGEERKKPGAAFWATVVLSTATLYVLTFGPAWWLASREKLPTRDVARTIYRPLIWAVVEYEGPLRWWAELGAARRGQNMEHEYFVVWYGLEIPYQQTSHEAIP